MHGMSCEFMMCLYLHVLFEHVLFEQPVPMFIKGCWHIAITIPQSNDANVCIIFCLILLAGYQLTLQFFIYLDPQDCLTRK
jgi:hypothetical protein